MSYLGGGLLGYVLNGLGPVLPHLQEALSLSRGQVAAYPTLYAAGMMVMGFAGHGVVGRWGRSASFRLAALALGAAAGLLAFTPSALLAGGGAVVMGASAALMMVVVQATLADEHGPHMIGAISEANAVSSFAAIVGPLVIGAALATGIGWRLGYAALPILISGYLAWAAIGGSEAPPVPAEQPLGVSPSGQRRNWLGILAVVAVEFAFVFWATDYMRSVVGLDDAPSAWLTSFFFVGMVTVRALGARFRVGRPERALLWALAVCLVGFGLFWAGGASSHSALIAGAGLLVAGSGVALLYPLSFTRFLQGSTRGSAHASGRAALASAAAIGLSPLLLGQVADATGLFGAMLVIPVLIVLAALTVVAASDGGQTHPV